MAKALTDITDLLDKARAETADAARLEALLEAYRRRPLPQLATLIGLAGRRATEYPMTGSLNDQHTMWMGVAILKRSIDLPWLLGNVITGRAEYSIERIEKLVDWPVDPRLSSGLLALADGKKMTARQSRAFWKHAFEIIGKQVHVQLSSILSPMMKMQPQTEFETWLMKKLHVLEARIGRLDIPSPSTTEKVALGKLAELLGQAKAKAAAKTSEDFLKEIWATPTDDSAREVFADWLQERDDPRGEFIALQLARVRNRAKAAARPSSTMAGVTLRVAEPDETKALARERALLAKHGKLWAAPFEPVLSMPNSTFERGFLHSVYVHWRKLASVPALMTHPAWVTVRHFKVDPEGAEAVDAWIDHMIMLGAKRE